MEPLLRMMKSLSSEKLRKEWEERLSELPWIDIRLQSAYLCCVHGFQSVVATRNDEMIDKLLECDGVIQFMLNGTLTFTESDAPEEWCGESKTARTIGLLLQEPRDDEVNRAAAWEARIERVLQKYPNLVERMVLFVIRVFKSNLLGKRKQLCAGIRRETVAHLDYADEIDSLGDNRSSPIIF